MEHGQIRSFRRFATSEQGSFGIIFALLLAPVLALAGLAVDYARLSSAEDRLQAAVDAGIIAAAGTGGKTSDMQRMAADMITANMGDERVKVDTVVDDYEIRVEARYEINMAMLALAGQMSREITVSARLVSARRLNSGKSTYAGYGSHGHTRSAGRRTANGNAPIYLAH